MRVNAVLLCILTAVLLVGCGGGGGSSTVVPFTVTYNAPSGAIPDGVSVTVTPKAASSFSTSLEGSAFVAAATCLPAGTAFNQPITLTFRLDTAVAEGKTVILFVTEDDGGTLTQVSGVTPTLSGDRKTVTIQVTSFPENEDYVLATTAT
jgi:threonine dehydratase